MLTPVLMQCARYGPVASRSFVAVVAPNLDQAPP